MRNDGGEVGVGAATHSGDDRTGGVWCEPVGHSDVAEVKRGEVASYQQPGSGRNAGDGDIGVSFAGGAAAEDFGEGPALSAAGPYHSGGAAVGVVATVVSALGVVLGDGKRTRGLGWRRMDVPSVGPRRGQAVISEPWFAPPSDSRGCLALLAFRTIRDAHTVRGFWGSASKPRHRGLRSRERCDKAEGGAVERNEAEPRAQPRPGDRGDLEWDAGDDDGFEDPVRHRGIGPRSWGENSHCLVNGRHGCVLTFGYLGVIPRTPGTSLWRVAPRVVSL